MGQLNDTFKVKNNMSAELEIRVPYDENSNNGLIIVGDKFIPNDLMIEIFCHYVDHNSLKTCQLVCKRWKDLIQSYIWRKKAEKVIHQSLPVDKNAPWTMYYHICDKKPLNRNLIKNHSGQKGWKSTWNIIQNGGNQWAVESPPAGVPILPKDPIFTGINYCYVTSYDICSKEQTVDLIKEGATEYLLDQMQPIIKISEWYSCRWDCPATYCNEIRLVDQFDLTLTSREFSKTLRGNDQDQWFKFECEFKNYGTGLRKIAFIHGGKDESFWRGHYGPKMAGACIVLQLPEVKDDDDDDDDDDCTTLDE